LLGADEPLSRDVLNEAGGLSRSHVLPSWVAKWFDNIRVEKTQGGTVASYVDIAPKAPISIGADVITIKGDGREKAPESIEKIQWPQAPPLIQEMENFVKPSWFETMRTMVKAGSHVSLESPPGMGKDTAVQQLAAQEGVPLVTVSGDGGFRRRDLVGTTELSNGSSFFQVAEYAAAAINGWWVLVTEVNAADADALLFINSQLAPPYVVNVHGKAYPVHPDFRLFISYNAGLIGTKPLPPAFKDRFFPVKIGFFNENGLRSRLEAWGLPSEETSWSWAVIQFGLRMWKAHTDGRMRYQITARRLIDAIKVMNMGMTEDVFKALRMTAISAIDSPIEAKAAERVLSELRSDFQRRYPDG